MNASCEKYMQLLPSDCCLCMCLQCIFSHACDLSAAQGLAPYQGLGLQSVTMPTTPVSVRTRHSPTCLKTAVSHMAEPPAVKKLPDNLSAPQLHPHTPAGQLYSESQRVQLQGVCDGSFMHAENTSCHIYIYVFILPFLYVVF